MRPSKSVDPIAKVRQLIRRKTSERDKLLKEIAQCETSLMPLQQHQRAMGALDREIHELFRAALANPKLSKRAQRDVRGIYESLQADQVISPNPEWARARAKACGCPACSREYDPELRTDPFDATEHEPPRAEPEPRAQQRPEREASVRALYRKLALRFHPDRAEDNERRAHHEAVMRDVNDAYHGGDTERLLALSRELGIDLGDLQEGDGLLAELVGQYERIKAEVRALRGSPVGTLVAQMRRARQHNYPSPIEDLHDQAATALQHLTETRDFVRDFTLGKISLKAFLRGPESGDLEVTESDEQMLEALEMLEQLERVVRSSQRGPRAKTRRAGSTRAGS